MNEIIAKVAVSRTAPGIDMLYDYLVPWDGEPEELVGRRVLVPFGNGNKTSEGYILALGIPGGKKALKKAQPPLDEEAFLNAEAVSLALWMRERYLCSYIDAIRLLIPAGASVKIETWVRLLTEDPKELTRACGRSGRRQAVAEELLKQKAPLTVSFLSAVCGAGVNEALSGLVKAGCVELYERDEQEVTDKMVRFVRLRQEVAEVRNILLTMQDKSHVQKRMLSILCEQELIPAADLVEFSRGSYNAIHSLIKKELVEYVDLRVERTPLCVDQDMPLSPPAVLNPSQRAAADTILASMRQEKEEVFLLHGVTGSGKTEVFLEAVDFALQKGKSALVLVSEISLTPQLTERFLRRFGARVAILHSKLSMGERYDAWKRIRLGEADVVIGARSAVFAPCQRLGVIILDEEHESSYKSETIPRYHARELAFFRAKYHHAAVVLSSATPSMESYYNAKRGIYTLLELPERFGGVTMPQVAVVDMTKELDEGNTSIFSRRLQEEIQKNLEQKEQTILFLNRRGHSGFVSCRSCGWPAKCPNCDISLTYHRDSNSLVCHYCGYNVPNYQTCPQCGSKYIRYFGVGTQRVEEEIHKLFPEASVLRMDVDTTGRKNSCEDILDKFAREKTDILVGTQMVAKGLDFENVTLVGAVAADIGLNADDFRASERSFSLLTQVSGRAGRAQKKGRSIIQTYLPDAPAVLFAQQQDYAGFFESELASRRMMLYPPYCRLVQITASSVMEQAARSCILGVKRRIASYAEEDEEKNILQILGPAQAGVFRVNNKYRLQILVKCRSAEKLTPLLAQLRQEHLQNRDLRYVTLSIDKNPL